MAANRAENILLAWSAIEVLSPQTFQRPEELVGGDSSRVVRLNGPKLPWERPSRKRPSYRLYYQVPLGSIRMQPALEALLERWGDSRPERPSNRRSALLGAITLSARGKPADSPAIRISSFAWGVVRALKGELHELTAWTRVEPTLTEILEKHLFAASAMSDTEEERDAPPLTAESLEVLFTKLVELLQLPREWVDPPSFAILSYVHERDPNPPESILLNSFFLDDLSIALSLLRAGNLPNSLMNYLRLKTPAARRDVKDDRGVLEEAVRPQAAPRAAWPAPGCPLPVLLQQAAVNLAFQETEKGHILAINGPPGTGKTTLLRDLVAAVVAKRAEALCRFDDPENAFVHSGQKIRAGTAWIHLYRLNPSIRGYEMVVASTNNKAVENVTAEIPGIGAVEIGPGKYLYFKTLSDALCESETWGLIAAVLGNMQNRARFKQYFWWDEDVSFRNYLRAALGQTVLVKQEAQEGSETCERPPLIVIREKPPRDHQEALERWKRARMHFQRVLEETTLRFRELEQLCDQVRLLSQLEHAIRTAEEAVPEQRTAVEAAAAELDSCQSRFEQARALVEDRREALQSHLRSRPSWLARLFRTFRARSWARVHGELEQLLRQAEEQGLAASNSVTKARQAHAQAQQKLQSLLSSIETNRRQLQEIQQRIQAARSAGVGIVDDEFFSLPHKDRQTASPWLSTELNRMRHQVFWAAMEVHRAFIDAAARPLRHNLDALMNVFTNPRRLGTEKLQLMPELWSSLFLVVPLISTTFASVERMFRHLPPESLGWLFVDEAGQAVPQAAVGAMMRCRRIVVVGDPAQLEPVVELPDQLVQAICDEFQVNSESWAAPSASVQTLADEACPCQSEFELERGSRTVGVPLLVHRRCSKPMFSISNTIAYSGQMVSLKKQRDSAIRNLLGPSCWFHVAGSAEDKWCPEEGDALMELLRQLADARLEPDFYVLTPFVIVAERLRKLIDDSGVWRAWMTEEAKWGWLYQRVGTVHTAQGREAEAVFLVLGAPDPRQKGARDWAGRRPNLLNVAVTRAKEAIYVIGNRSLWREAGVFRELDRRLREP
jgi:energy-coupling factor transporter ATP-binding protein EcfA2